MGLWPCGRQCPGCRLGISERAGGERARGCDLGRGPQGRATPVCESRAVCVCARVFAGGPRGQRPSLRHAVGPPSEGHGMGLGVHPLTRPNRFAWEENAQKTVGMCPQVPRERLLGSEKSRRSRSGACSPLGYAPAPRSSLPQELPRGPRGSCRGSGGAGWAALRHLPRWNVASYLLAVSRTCTQRFAGWIFVEGSGRKGRVGQ